ncbi:Uncharacterised protein [Yersinia kristensenii]|nr:Uncharacterised protein [Yersinia kristensenii]CNK44572.1 Uncharacterised protein [Yersinia kristensenii]
MAVWRDNKQHFWHSSFYIIYHGYDIIREKLTSLTDSLSFVIIHYANTAFNVNIASIIVFTKTIIDLRCLKICIAIELYPYALQVRT